VLTFLAEWGDRSQIATTVVVRFDFPLFKLKFPAVSSSNFITELEERSSMQLATHKNAVGVATGATLGHTTCTSIAVVGGSMLASKISQGTVATIGGLLFLGFSLSSYFYPPCIVVHPALPLILVV
jgi:putative Ca2+/H+ antiporter (TMEM165/GDT1 family)